VRSYKKHIVFVLLVFFISLRLLELHGLFHDNEASVEDCEVCEHVIVSNKIPCIVNELYTVEQRVQHNYEPPKVYGYFCLVSNTIISSNLFCRPPPIA